MKNQKKEVGQEQFDHTFQYADSIKCDLNLVGQEQLQASQEEIYDEISSINSSTIRDKLEQKDKIKKLFNDSIASTIQKTDHHQYIEDGYEDLEDERSARRLMTANNANIFGKGEKALTTEKNKNSNVFQGGKASSLREVASNNTMAQSKEFINLVEQSKDNLLLNGSKARFEQSSNLEYREIKRYMKEPMSSKMPQNRTTTGDLLGYLKKNSGNAMTRGNTQEVDNNELEFDIRPELNEIEEGSCLLDESQLEKELKMPQVGGKKETLQKDLGHYLKTESDQNQDKILEELVSNESFYRVVDQDSIEVIEQYHDKCPCLNFRKQIMKIRVYIVRGSAQIISHTIFESLSILVICGNCFFLVLDDPTAVEKNPIMDMSDYIFQALYTVEMLLKIFGKGFVMGKGAYLKDAWNILDFVIVVSGYITFIMSTGSGGGQTNISALRSFRVLRPLRTISGVEGLRVIVTALLNSLPLLRDAIMVLCFFYFIFAIAGVQLFQGALKNRCINEDTGILIDDDTVICGAGNKCDDGYFCGKSNKNPNYGVSNFDNILYGLLAVFQTVSLEGWTQMQIGLWRAMGPYVVAFFVPIIFIGAWFLMNLTLAVIKSKFTEQHHETQKNKGKNKKKKKKKKDHELDEEELMKLEIMEAQKEEEKKHSDEDLNDEQKQHILNKIRIEHFLNKVDYAIMQREMQSKLTPRNGLIMSSQETERGEKQATQVPPLLSALFSSSKTKRSQSSETQQTKIPNTPNVLRSYGELFNSRVGLTQLEPIEEKAETHRPSIQLLNQKDIYSKSTIGAQRQKRNSNSNQEASLSIDERRNSKNQKAQSNGFNQGNEKDFELERMQKTSQDFQKNNQFKKMKMVGMITIKTTNQHKRCSSQSPIRENTEKKTIYDKIAQNMDIFEFFEEDQQVDKNSSIFSSQSFEKYRQNSFNSTKREERMNQIKNMNLNPDDVEDIIDFEPPSTQIQPVGIGRKQTGETNDQKSVTKFSNGMQSHYHGFGKAFASMKEDVYNQHEEEFKVEQVGRTTIFRKATFRETANDFEVQLDEEEMKIEKEKRKFAKKKLAKKQTIKDKISHYFKKASIEKSKKKEIQQKKLARKMFGSQDAKSQNSSRGTSQMNDKSDKFEKDKIPSNSIMPLTQKISLANIASTVRAKSQQSKLHHMLYQKQQYEKRQAEIKKKRNKFFAKSIRKIGKTSRESANEQLFRVLLKREVILGGGLETFQPPYKKKPIYRCASMIEAEFDIFRQKSDDLVPQRFKQDLEKQRHRKNIKRQKVRDVQYEIQFLVEEQKKKIFKDDQIDDSNIDMEQRLIQNKKKVVLKNFKYDFNSKNDVFELRGGFIPQVIEKKVQPKVQVKKEEGETHQAEDEHKVEEQKPKKGKKKEKIISKDQMKGYQKKVVFDPKKNFDELFMEEGHDSDENQDAMLRRIEQQYNIAHRSNIHVTGTLSIVINQQIHFKKIMNNNYFANLKSQNSQNVSSSINMSMSAIRDDNNNMSIISEGERQSKSLDSSRAGVNKQAATKSKTQKARPQSPLTGMKRQLSPLKSMRTNNFNTNDRKMQASSAGPAIRIPKPVILTDKQILRRLNNEYKKSAVFSSVSKITKLPNKIQKIQNDKRILPINNKKPPKKPKGQNNNAHHAAVNPAKTSKEDDDFSDSSEEVQDQAEKDFFVDREINGEKEVVLAKKAATGKRRDLIEWSGQDIMARFDPYKARIALSNLNEIRVWPHGFFGYVKRWRTLLKRIMKSGLVDNFLILCVACNTVVLTIDHYGISTGASALLAKFNKFFTIIFCLEMGLKIMAIGLTKYLADKMNYLDGTVVILSIVEVAFMSGGGALSAFRSVRMFRTFRVLRVARLLRSMKSMMNIIAVIQRSISSFAYLAMLLFLFIFIYALLGMQLFGGKLTFEDGDNCPFNFDTFNNSFVFSFIILTQENWNQYMYYAMRSGVNFIIVQFYFISWIFIGNYMLLNLFLSILLDSFTAVEEEDHETPEKLAERERQRKIDLVKKEGEEMITEMNVMQASNMKMINDNGSKKKKKKKKKKKADEPEDQNMLDEYIDLDLETLALKQEEALKQKEPFEGIECEISYFLMSKKNWIRIFCYKLTTHPKFETGILVLIVFSTLKLIFDTYIMNTPPDDLKSIISDKLDYVFTAMFTMETATKSISLGLCMHKNTYLRETWNQLDFFIVITSLIDMSLTNVDLPIIKVLRLLRILRPLRFISHNSNMKTVVVALLQSMGAILNVGIVVSLVYMMFAILAVNLFGGKMQYCDTHTYTTKNKKLCDQIGGNWLTYNQNFDSVPRAMMTLFAIANQEGWPDILRKVMDQTGVESGPRPDAGVYNAYFFVAFVFVGSFFFMNLFVGVIFMNFESAQRDEKEALCLDSKEVKWVDIMRMIINTKPEITKFPKNKYSQWCYKVTKAESKFDFIIMCCIISNMLLMAMNYEGQPKKYTGILEKFNYFFTTIFALEATLKMIGQGSSYFANTWNKFDFFVVSASFIDIAMNFLQGGGLKFLRIGPQLARVLRVMRVSRLFRLLNKYKGLQALIQTIMFSLPSLMNILALLLLVFFIFAVLGVYLFANIRQGVMINEDFMNFSNFGMAMIILFRMSTGEDWPTIMYDTMNTKSTCIPNKTCGTSIAPLYFMAFIMICTYVMLNLFILVILQQFELYYLPQDNIFKKFQEDLAFFKITWNKFAKDFDGLKIPYLKVVDFFKQIQGRLGFQGEKDEVVLRNIVKMDVNQDEEGFVYFNELLFKAMKRKYGEEKTKKKVLADLEFRTLAKLEQIKKQMILKSRKKERIRVGSANPFLTIMYKIANKQKRSEEIQNGIDRDSSDEETYAQKHQQEQYEYVTDGEAVTIQEEDEIIDQIEELNEDIINVENVEQNEQDQQVNQNEQENSFAIKLKETKKNSEEDASSQQPFEKANSLNQPQSKNQDT